MKILRERQYHERTEYRREYELEGRGYSFPVEKGDVVLDNPGAEQNYRKCLAAGIDKGVKSYLHSWWENAIGECVNCGEEVELRGFTNTCECGADYNSSGQLLGPREQWGEETGESLSDILNIP